MFINVDRVSTYMESQIEARYADFDPWNCGEINSTLLAEDAAREFDLYGDKDKVPERLFEIAFDVVERTENEAE